MHFPTRLLRVTLCAFLVGTQLVCPVKASGQGSAPIIHQGYNTDHAIALTFDDGPHPLYTPQILDILAEYGVHATFFVIGENVEQHPDLLGRVVAEGHEIGNHTQSHPLKITSPEEMEREMAACEAAIGESVDLRPHLFRPPGGNLSQAVTAVADTHRYRVILWSIDTRDWAHTPVPQITKTVLREVGDGDIILMHDGIDAPSPTPEALRVLIPELLRRGYRFVTVSELLDAK